MINNIIAYTDILKYYRKQRDPIYFSALALKQMKGERILSYSQEILKFISYRETNNPLELYSKRCEFLNKLQEKFEREKKYSVSSYMDIKSIDRGSYNLALLLSFITTNHRFEILDKLVEFIKLDQTKSHNVLSVGVGTGYEIKLIYDCLKNSEIMAFDNSTEAIDYSKELLSFFNYPTNCLKSELFPLEKEANLDKYIEKFDKVIICELLEHLEHPVRALLNLKQVLAPKGKMFLTMAINIAQEDHIYLYSNIRQARDQVVRCGFNIISETISPVVFLPFCEKDRKNVFKRGNYICSVSKE